MLMDVDPRTFGGAVNQRREGKRHASVLLIGKVVRADGETACLIHDISKNGLMARFTRVPEVGEQIRLNMRGLPEVTATVRWVRGARAGVEFAEPQDLDRVFCVKDDQGVVARTPRFDCHVAARMRIGAATTAVEVVDISPGGMKLRSDMAVQRGQAGGILLPGAAVPVYGTICWIRDDRFGFRFATPLPLDELARIIDL